MTGNKTPRPWKLQAVQSAKDRKWYLRLSGGNGEIVMRSKGYACAAHAEEIAEEIRKATIVVLPKSLDVLEDSQWLMEPVKSTKDGHWYNQLRRPNDTIAMWSEGYPRVDSARRACERTRDAMVVILPPHALRK